MLRWFWLSLPILLAACAGPASKPEPAPATAPAAASAEPASGVFNDGVETAGAARDAHGEPVEPRARVVPHVVESPNGGRSDPYYLLRDDQRSNPEMLAYLKAENAYRDAMLSHLKSTEDVLFNEIVSRIKQDDASVPQRENGWWYYTRFVEGREYPVYARRKAQPDGSYSDSVAEQVLLDGNQMAEGLGFFQIGNTEVTADGRMLAWVEDTVGRRQWVLRFKNLDTGEVLSERIANVEASLAWANDHRTILYIEKDPVTLLGYKVRKHVLGTDPSGDPLVYEEKDRSFYMGVEKSRSGRFLFIGVQSTVSSEQWVADANDPQLHFKVLIPRERDHEYQAEDHGDAWIVRTNWQAKNFRIVRAPMARVADRNSWRDVVAHRPDGFVHEALVFRDQLAVSLREGGLRQLRVVDWASGRMSSIEFKEAPYAAYLGDNPEQDSGTLRYRYTSMTTPGSTIDYGFGSGTHQVMKRDPVLGDFDSNHYASEFVFATARDGAKIPVSIVYRKGFQRDGKAALYQYAYGSYGSSTDPSFSIPRLSLLDRGVVYAIAHIRGGQEMGRSWYEDGKLLKKTNTFHDFIDVTDYLVANGYAAKDRVVAMGGSAGGLLMGAIANLAPDRYRAIVAHVPFVDVVTTMLDESIPLTTNEFDEWGNPRDKVYYDYMLAYSPYDNVARKAYPAMLVTTGLWDSQVQYYEPAKWVARLRDMKTDRNPLVFKINMEAGHGGKSGRFQRYRETAEEYAFLFDQLDIEVRPASGSGFELDTGADCSRGAGAGNPTACAGKDGR
jgi:oligopeptidase B